MITEIAQIDVKPGTNQLFEAAVAKAAPLFQRARGCRSMRLEQIIEEPQSYRLVVEWETLEDHEVHFRGSADFQEWRKLVGEYFSAPPRVVHSQLSVHGF
jgi:heme-degrading monooxygenase HmoA